MMRGDESQSRLVPVYTTSNVLNPALLELMVSGLAANGIAAFVESEIPFTYIPVPGLMRVMVAEVDAERARKYLADCEHGDAQWAPTEEGTRPMLLDESGQPMVPIYVCWDDGEAEIVISYLAAQGVEAVANSQVPHTVLPIEADGLGQIEILVRDADVEAAEEALDNLPEGDDDEE